MPKLKKILVLGSGGRLGAALARAYERDCEVIRFNHVQLDLADLEKVRHALSDVQFDLLINCAALTNVDYCESHRDEATRINAEAPRVLAQVCRGKTAKLIHFSTDYVFDGEQKEAYTEDHEAKPLSVYGESKLRGEENVLHISDRFLVVRVSWVFGPDRPSFVDNVIKRARETLEVAAVADKFSTPTYTIDVVEWLRAAWENDISGILHLVNSGRCSWQEYAQYALDCCGERGMPLRAERVGALQLADMNNFVARRPVNSVLSSARFSRLTGVDPRGWREAVADYIRNYVAKL